MVMTAIPIQALRENPEELLRRVDEEGETIEVVHLGRVLARIVPAPLKQRDPHQRPTSGVLADIDRFCEGLWTGMAEQEAERTRMTKEAMAVRTAELDAILAEIDARWPVDLANDAPDPTRRDEAPDRRTIEGIEAMHRLADRIGARMAERGGAADAEFAFRRDP